MYKYFIHAVDNKVLSIWEPRTPNVHNGCELRLRSVRLSNLRHLKLLKQLSWIYLGTQIGECTKVHVPQFEME